MNFNPHHREGGDRIRWITGQQYQHFNPHHREGGDFPSFILAIVCFDFNPHHREGGDEISRVLKPGGIISIHTTAKVVTVNSGNGWSNTRDFNPHHREGGDTKNHQI